MLEQVAQVEQVLVVRAVEVLLVRVDEYRHRSRWFSQPSRGVGRRN